MSTKGGFRKGAGRPKNTGKYKEETKSIRVPLTLVPYIEDILLDYLNSGLSLKAFRKKFNYLKNM